MTASETQALRWMQAKRNVGWVKTFSTTRGYGFIVDLETGRDIFVHHQSIDRKTPGFRAIWRGEYVEFYCEETERGVVARNVTGIRGGPLFCEVETGAEPRAICSAGAQTSAVQTEVPEQPLEMPLKVHLPPSPDELAAPPEAV